MEIDYKKYRWTYTSSGKLVFGGKSAEQNEEVVRLLIQEAEKNKGDKDYLVMHTHAPGSPFAVLFSKKYDEKDLEDCAIFCACFSRAWKEGQKKAKVDIFRASQLFKERGMRVGTFGVLKKAESRNVDLQLCLEVQQGVLRGVPYRKGKKSCLICLKPGSISKEKAAEEIANIIGFKKQEVLEALPTGGFVIDRI